MTSITTYTPFTYCITFIITGQRYYGVRYAKGCHPDQLWSIYFTSSTKIKSLIEKHGKDSFTFQIRKIFNNKQDAQSWESKVLIKLNAANNPNWLNKKNGSSNFHVTPESTQKGIETKIKKGNLNSNSLESIQKCLETKKKNGTGMDNPDIVQKIQNTRKKNGTGMDNPDIVQKMLNTFKERNIIYPMKNPETVQKMLATRKERGIKSPSQIPFLSMIHNKKTYARCNISKYFPSMKQYY